MKAIVAQQAGQQLHLTPQLLQSIRLLQLDGLQLEMEVRRALEHNPLLELDEAPAEVADGASTDTAALDVAAFDELPEASMWDVRATSWQDGDDDRLHRVAAGESTDPQLRALQRLALELDQAQLGIAAFWLEHCNDAGYLEGDHAALIETGSRRFGVAPAALESVRQRLLHGDPAGMAARDPRECLLAQLASLPGAVPGRHLAQRILETSLDLLAGHELEAIAARLRAERDDVGEAVRLILSLQPRPGEELLPEQDVHVVPDVVVWFADGQWRVALNPACTPRLSINPAYERALAAAGDGEGAQRLRELAQQARWLTHGLSMRYDTLLRTAHAIVERQAAYLAQGDEAMAPLTLKEIADRIGVHESTVSRITSGKYMQTPRGTFELKHFLAVRLEGANVSGAAVKAMVRRLIESEPPQCPLADEAIAALLARQGIHIARRTVAKYREQLDIAPVRARRRNAGPLLARTG